MRTFCVTFAEISPIQWLASGRQPQWLAQRTKGQKTFLAKILLGKCEPEA
jgi:hypothetical protein